LSAIDAFRRNIRVLYAYAPMFDTDDLEIGYLRRWAAHLNVDDLLEELSGA
jgi:hypothetical protein